MFNKLSKFPLFCLFALLCAASANAQNAVRYQLDNFDLADGVRIDSVPATATLPPAGRPRAAVRVTPARDTSAATRAEARPQPVSMAISHSLDGYSTGNQRIDQMILESGRRNGVDPVLLYAIMHQESAFRQTAVSHAGARGLMQLMPATAARFGVRSIFDPAQNIEGGARYMRWLLNFFDGDVTLALAGYNAGEGAVLRYGRRIPPFRETQDYVRRITNRYAMMRDPQTARRARPVTGTQIAALETQGPTPPLYERNIFTVRLPDGSLRLVSQ